MLTTNASEYYGITHATVEHLTYHWTIRNFSLLPQENGDSIGSPIFHTEGNDVAFQVLLYPRGFDFLSTGYVSVSLHLQSQPAGELSTKVHCNMLILRNSFLKSNVVYVNESMDYTYYTTTSHGWSKFVSRSDLMELPCSEDTVIIRAEITMPLKIVTKSLNITRPREQELSHDSYKCRWAEYSASAVYKDEEKKESEIDEMQSEDMEPIERIYNRFSLHQRWHG